MTPAIEMEAPVSNQLIPGAKPREDEKSVATLSGLSKAAVLMLALNNDARTRILRVLSEEEVERITREVARLGPVPSTKVVLVLDEFETLSRARSFVLQGSVDQAKTMLTEAFGPEVGLTIVDRILKSLGTDTVNLVTLQKSDPRQLSKLIYNEHPQVIALVLSHLIPAQAAALLTALPAEIRADVTKRMAQLDQYSPEIVEKIAAYIGRRLKSLGEFSRRSYGGVRAVAEMMNRLDKDSSDEVLGAIATENESLSETIRQLMFVFDDLLKMDKQDISLVIAKVDRKVLALALKGSSPGVRAHFSQTLSERGRAMLEEEIADMGPVRIREIEGAKSQIVAIVRQLQTEGVIGAQSPDDGYVN